MAKTRWEHFPHPADMGIRGYGPTKAAALEQAGLAMMAVMVDLDTVRPGEAVEIVCREQDDDFLLLAWLNALLYEIDTRRMVFCRFGIQVNGDHLQGRAWGEPMDPARHSLITEVKAATLAELKVGQGPDGTWLAQCIVDV